MLVQVGGNDGLRLDVDEVLAVTTVGADLDAQREVGVGVDVPEGFAEEGVAAVEGAEGGVAGALDGGIRRREGGGDMAVEFEVAVGIVGFLGGSGRGL